MKTTAPLLALLLFSCIFVTSHAQNCTVNAGIPQTICANSTLSLQGQANGSFPGGTAALTWSQVTGPLTTITSPNTSSTTVTGLSAGTYVYQLSTTCLDGSSISDNVTITVRPVVTAVAGVSATYCPGTYALAANSPSPGTGAWSVVGSNYGITISTTSSATSNIVVSPTNSGNTTLRWTISQTTSGTTCTSYDDVIITNRGGVATVSAGNNIVLNNCYTTTQITQLNASYGGSNINGQQGTWSQVSGPNTASFSNLNAANATASNLVQGTYVFRWTVAGPCVNGTADVQVTVPAPTSSLTTIGNIATQSFCDGRTSTVLTATQPAFAGETATWSVVGGAGTFSNSSSYSTTVSGIGSGTNTYRYTITSAAGCTTFKDAVVNNVAAPTVAITTASPVTVACGSSSTTINFTTTGGTGTTQYRVVAGPSGYTLPTSWSNAGATSFTVNGLNLPGTYLVRVMRNGTSDCSPATQDISVIVSRTPTASNAGTDQLLACNVTSTALAGNIPTLGTGCWSQVSGPTTAVLADPSQYNSGVSSLVPGAYLFKWIINAGNGCTPSEDIVTVRVANAAPTTANAGTDQVSICHTGPVKLSANTAALNEVGTWTVSPSTGISFSNVNDPKAVVSGMAANTTYTFTWSIVNGCGSSSDDVIISTNSTQGAGQAYAGADRCLSTGTTSVTMAATPASPASAVGTWTLVSGPNTPTFANVNSATTNVTGLVQGTYVFAWTLNVAGCGTVSSNVVATVSPTLTTSNPGTAQTICAANTTLAGNVPSVGTGAWSQVSGPGGATISDPSLNNTSVVGLVAGLYKFRWTISSGACSNSNDVLVTISTPPSTAVVSADSTCLTRTSLNAMTGNTPSNGIGTWSQVSGPNVATITNTASSTSGLSGLINGNYVFRWTISGGGGCSASSANMNVSVNMPTSAFSSATNYCNTTAATLTGNTNIAGIWSQSTGPSSSSIQNVAPNIGTITGLQPGTYTFQFTPTPVTGCAALTPRTLTLNNSAPATAASAGVNQSLCNVTTFGLSANAPTTGTGTWSRQSGPNTPALSSASATTPTVSGAVAGLYTYRWTIANGGCTSASDVTVSISAAATAANTGSNQTICSTTANASLSANTPTVGTGTWSQVGGPTTATLTNAAATATAVNGLSTPGNYTFRWTITNGACSNFANTIVQVDEAPTSSAGPNETVSGSNYTLKATQPAVGTGTWSQVAGPASTIANKFQYNTTITGLQTGSSYTYRWAVSNGAVCAAATSDVTLNVTSVLPLTLTSFTGELRNGNTLLLWKAANEKNVARYEIERSISGISFSRAGTVVAANLTTYTFSETYPIAAAACYYRLKMVDANGKFTYSPVVRISTTTGTPALAVVPNPVRDNLVIKIEHNKNENAVLTVFDATGQKIYGQTVALHAGSQFITVAQSQHLPAGTYQVFVNLASGVQLKTVALVVR